MEVVVGVVGNGAGLVDERRHGNDGVSLRARCSRRRPNRGHAEVDPQLLVFLLPAPFRHCHCTQTHTHTQRGRGETKKREVEPDSHENPGHNKSRKVELDSQENTRQFTSREVELDSQENPGQIKSREVIQILYSPSFTTGISRELRT